MGKLRDLLRRRQTDHGHPDEADPDPPRRGREERVPAETFYKHALASRSTLSLNRVRDLVARTARRGDRVDKDKDEDEEQQQDGDGGRVERMSMASWMTGVSEQDFVGPPSVSAQSRHHGALLDDGNDRLVGDGGDGDGDGDDEQDASSPVSSLGETITRHRRLTACSDGERARGHDEQYQDTMGVGGVSMITTTLDTGDTDTDTDTARAEGSTTTAHSSPADGEDQDQDHLHLSVAAEEQDENDDGPSTPHQLPAIEPFSPLRNSMAHLLLSRPGAPSRSRSREHLVVQAAASASASVITGGPQSTLTTKPDPDPTPGSRADRTTRPCRSTRPGAPPTRVHPQLQYKARQVAPSSPTEHEHEHPRGYDTPGQRQHPDSRRIREFESLVDTYESAKREWKREREGWKMISRDQNEVIQMQKEEIEALKYGRRHQVQDGDAGAQLPPREDGRYWYGHGYGKPNSLPHGDEDRPGAHWMSSNNRRLAGESGVCDLSTVEEVSEISEYGGRVECE